MQRKYVYFILVCLGLFGSCGDVVVQEGAAEPAPAVIASVPEEQKVSFEDFLGYFETDEDFADWPRAAQWPLVEDPGFFQTEDLKPLLSRVFKPLLHSCLGWIPMGKIQQLDSFSAKIALPAKAFDFYAFRKVKLAGAWLVGIYAQKRTGNAHNEYNGHPFLMVTYNDLGKVIDDYCWWWIEDDVLQVWTEIAVHGDTFLTGRKLEISDADLDEVYSKVVVDSDGKFREVYADYPEPSRF